MNLTWGKRTADGQYVGNLADSAAERKDYFPAGAFPTSVSTACQ